jgi:nucleoporin NDC1
MWELALIAQNFPDRRKVIYEDIDRKDGSMWSQVLTICLEMLKSMEKRIDSYDKPPQPPPSAAVVPVEPKTRTTEPPKEAPIFQSTPQKKAFRNEVEKAVNQVTTSPGQGSQLSPLAKKAMATAKEQLLKLQKEATGSDDPRGLIRDYALKVLNSSVGWPFRQEYARRLVHTVFGSPYGEPSLYINAIYALNQLAVRSLTEDKYGNVQRDIATIIRTLTTVTKKLDSFKTTLPTHWTDVEGKRESPEVSALLDVLRETLSQLILEFGPYARDLRLTLTDMRLAKEAAGVPIMEPERLPPMREVR